MQNFDEIIDRRGSNDMKHTLLKSMFGRDDLLPLWIADMDWATPSFILDALCKRLEHPILGYTDVPDAYFEAIVGWVKMRHDWDIRREWIAYIPGIVKGIAMAELVFTEPGDKIIIQPPVYHPFRMVSEGNGRQVLENPLREVDGFYEMDLDHLESLMVEKPKMLILSNPHNPVGICWKPETLRRVADICHKNGVIVISDEIHCDMALFGHRHTPFAGVSDAAAACSITFQAPTKTFNIAGVISSYAVVPNDTLRRRFFSWLETNEQSAPNMFAPIATIAAFSKEGEAWRREMLSHVESNVEFVENYCREHLPQIRAVRPEASFLVWLDCRALRLSVDELNSLFVDRAHLALNSGAMFGRGGEGFMRLNVGTPRPVLADALERLRNAL